MHPSLEGLPETLLRLVPELTELAWPAEARSTCDDCVMARPHPQREVFLAEVRCCGFFPRVPNYAIGAILADGADGADAVQHLLERGLEVVELGIDADPEWKAAYRKHGRAAFGQVESLRCPYWSGGDHACSIWLHRNATCRTWFCKHDDGPTGRALWGALKDVLARLEFLVARQLSEGRVAPSETEPAEAWDRYYRGCAEDLAALGPEELDPLAADPTLVRLREQLRERHEARPKSLPDVLGPALTEWHRGDDRVWLYGYSTYDEVEAPGDIFQLLGRLDGEQSWRLALDEAARAGHPQSPELVAELFRVGALEARDGTGIPEHGTLRLVMADGEEHWQRFDAAPGEDG